MASDEKVLKRLRDLHEAGSKIPVGDQGLVDQLRWHSWLPSALQAVRITFGADSPHFLQLAKCADIGWNAPYDSQLRMAVGVVAAAVQDYEGGFAQSLESRLTGEILGDFIGLAKEALREGHHTVAAVLACAALEDVLKRYAAAQGLDVGESVMQQVVNALKKGGLVSGAQKSLLDTLPKLRDYAMHANWEKISPAEVGGVIGFVEHFLLTKFT